MRNARLQDRRIVDKVVRACGKQVADYFAFRNLKGFYKDNNVWMAWADDSPVGFAVAKPLLREPVISLYELGVIPAYRGQGIARRIMDTIAGEHPDRRWRLVVNDDNVEARIAYERMGLVICGYDVTRKGVPIVRMEGKLR